MSSLRLAVLVDPHPLWLGALDDVLVGLKVENVRSATSIADANGLIAEEAPDLLVTELEFGNGPDEGIELIRRAREVRPSMHVIVLSSTADLAAIDAALGAGAQAFVIKTADPDDIVSAVRLSLAKTVYLAPAAGGDARGLTGEPGALDGQRGGATPLPAAPAPAPAQSQLTEREREILGLVSVGNSNAQVARALWVTEQTVKFHLSNIYRKLGAANRTEASRIAERLGIFGERERPEPEAAPQA